MYVCMYVCMYIGLTLMHTKFAAPRTQHDFHVMTMHLSQYIDPCLSPQCIPGYGVHVMYKMFNEPPPKMIVLGGGCSKVSQPTAESSHYWNVVQVGNCHIIRQNL